MKVSEMRAPAPKLVEQPKNTENPSSLVKKVLRDHAGKIAFLAGFALLGTINHLDR